MGAPRFVLDRFWPSNLFLGGIPGAWYDPTDLSTMFQDSAGTTPVTAVEQPVGLILDKSQGLTQGSQLVVNGDGTTLTGWTTSDDAGCSSTVSGGQFVLSTVAGGAARLRQTIPTTAGKTYAVSIFCNTSASNATAAFTVWGAAYGITTLYSAPAVANGVITAIVQATSANIYLQLSAFSVSTGLTNFYDDVSVRELAGNHASQSTAASRPTYRARYNLLTYSEQFDDAAWVKDSAGTGVAPVVTPNAGTAPDGTTTADRVQFNRGAGTPAFSRIRQTGSAVASTTCTWSVWMRTFSGTGTQFIGLRIDGTGATCTVTGTWQRFQISATATAADCQILSWTSLGSDQTADLLVWGAQLLTAADVTATGNAYQRIAAATVYDTAPIFRPYLAFDGMDDSLATAAINFTSTNKMTVCTGLSKLSDATLAIFAELSTVTGPNAGSWYIAAPITTGAGGNYSWRNAGTALSGSADSGTLLAPNTSVLTGTCDIGTLTQALRVNGALAASGIVAIGGGNYGNWPLFIGRRNNASFPFNGRLYSLIVRGAASSVTEIADTELWVNQRTGAY